MSNALAARLPDLAQGWLLTYLLHSTLLLGCAWLLTRLVVRMPTGLRESLWRVALLGGVLTASVQAGLGFEALGGRMEIPREPPAREAHAVAPREGATVAWKGARAHDTQLPARGESSAAQAVAPSQPEARTGTAWLAPLLGALWLAGALLAGVRFARGRRRLRAHLTRREPITEGALRATLDRLAGRARLSPVRLTRAGRIASPVALGIRRREICVPQRALRELTQAQCEVMLAHELAHHLRRDPVWLAVGRWMEALFFFQPLNVLAGRHLRETAELLCDAWAVEHVGDRRALAECLTRVAGWMVDRDATLPLPAMAQHGASLEVRVRRLLEDGDTRRIGRRVSRLLACLPLAAVALIAPTVSRAEGRMALSPTTAPTPILEPVRVQPLATALARLEDELRALSGECAHLVALLERIERPPLRLRQGIAELNRRRAALESRRGALLEQVRTHMESNR